MLLKKIEIKNFRNINYINVDFTVNSSGSKLDLKRGNFVNVQNGKILPQVLAFIGPNSVGKTNILKSLHFIKYLTFKLNDFLLRQIVLEKEKGNLNISEKEISNKVQELKKKLEKKDSLKIFEEFLSLKKELILNLFLKESSDSTKPIEISLTFQKDNQELFSSVLITKDSVILKNENVLIKFLKDIFYFNETTFTFINLPINVDDNTILEKPIYNLGPTKLLSLLQIADPSIISVFEKNKKILFRTKQSTIDLSFESLSSGTKRFLYLASFILKALKNKKGIYILDEIELYLHKELAEVLVLMMNMIVRQNKNITFLFTTHNPLVIDKYIKYKQVIEIKEDKLNKIHNSKTLSSLFKEHESVENKYKKGIISDFPSKSFAYDNLSKVVNE